MPNVFREWIVVAFVAVACATPPRPAEQKKDVRKAPVAKAASQSPGLPSLSAFLARHIHGKGNDSAVFAITGETEITLRSGEEADYVLEAANAEGGQLIRPDFGTLSAKGPFTSQQTTITVVGGVMKSRGARRYAWTITPNAPGQYRISEATLVAGPRTVHSNAVLVNFTDR